MTVLAMAKTSDTAILVADTPKGTLKDGSMEYIERVDNICQLGECFVSVCGDDQALNAAYSISSWCRGYCPDFLSDQGMACLVKWWMRGGR